MSDAPEAAPQRRPSGATRTILLLLVLLIIIAAGLWDWYGAKQPRDEAYDRVDALKGTSPQYDSSQPAATQEDVHKAVGIEPAESVEEKGPNGPVIYERFSWRRGVPWMTYDLWVLYYGDGNKEMLVALKDERPDAIYAANARKGAPPVPDPSTVKPPTNYPTPEEPAASTESDQAADGEGAPQTDEPAAGDADDAPAPEEGTEEEAPAASDDASEAESDEAPAEEPAADSEAAESPSAPPEGEAGEETP